MFRGSKLLATLAVVGLTAVIAVGVASAAPVANGDFETGDLTGWTTFTTANGTIGTPAVVPFDTTGTGASNAAQFGVGQVVFTPGVQEGGGIYQSVSTAAGLFDASADVAARAPVANNSCGLFELLVDGVVVASHNTFSLDFTLCPANTTVRSTLSAAGLALSAGSHEIRIRITRPFITSAQTPLEYVDNVSLTQVLPTTADQCKKDGWKTYLVFKNQGDCVSFVATGGKNPPAGD
jgi:hypothetical protein